MNTIGINEGNLPGLQAGNQQIINTSQEKVELFLSCRNLKNMDAFSLTDPKIRVYSIENGEEKLIGETEMIQDNLNPDFAKTFIIDYIFEVKQPLHFEVIDIDGPNKWELVGHVYTSLGEVVGSRNQLAILNIVDKNKTNGKLIVRSERVSGTEESALFEISAKNLMNRNSWLSPSSPYFKFTRMTGDSGKVVVFESEAITKNLNPRWKPLSLSMQTLCNGDHHRPINLEIYTRKGFREKLLGQCTFTVDEILNQEKREFILNNPEKKKKSGLVQIHNFSIGAAPTFKAPTFLNYLRGGVQLNVMVAVDFTASNGSPSQSSSLHYMQNNNGQLNQYQKAIQGVCDILLCYDYDKQIPVYGFGGKPSGVSTGATSHCFPLNGNDRNASVSGLDGIMDAYDKALRKVVLDGPTNFEAILKKAMEMAQKNKRNGSKEYLILLILTDGQIHDMQSTINCLIQSAGLPLSVIIVGVGNADFRNMEVLDGDDGLQNDRGLEAERDLVQFVPFNKFGGNKELLAKEVLAEIPTQLVEYMNAAKILPGRKEEVDLSRLLMRNQTQQL